MVILFVIVSCYLLRVIPNSLKPFLVGVWGFCSLGFLLMITEIITVNNVEVIKSMTIISIGGVGTLLYGMRESAVYNKRKAKLLQRWKNEVTLENAA